MMKVLCALPSRDTILPAHLMELQSLISYKPEKIEILIFCEGYPELLKSSDIFHIRGKIGNPLEDFNMLKHHAPNVNTIISFDSFAGWASAKAFDIPILLFSHEKSILLRGFSPEHNLNCFVTSVLFPYPFQIIEFAGIVKPNLFQFLCAKPSMLEHLVYLGPTGIHKLSIHPKRKKYILSIGRKTEKDIANEISIEWHMDPLHIEYNNSHIPNINEVLESLAKANVLVTADDWWTIGTALNIRIPSIIVYSQQPSLYLSFASDRYYWIHPLASDDTLENILAKQIITNGKEKSQTLRTNINPYHWFWQVIKNFSLTDFQANFRILGKNKLDYFVIEPQEFSIDKYQYLVKDILDKIKNQLIQHRSKWFFITGPLGAGKSSILKCLTHLLKREYGDAVIFLESPNNLLNDNIASKKFVVIDEFFHVLLWRPELVESLKNFAQDSGERIFIVSGICDYQLGKIEGLFEDFFISSSIIRIPRLTVDDRTIEYFSNRCLSRLGVSIPRKAIENAIRLGDGNFRRINLILETLASTDWEAEKKDVFSVYCLAMESLVRVHRKCAQCKRGIENEI